MASVGFIGGGRVARILIGGWQRARALPQALLVCEPDDAAFRALEPHAPAAHRVSAGRGVRRRRWTSATWRRTRS